MIGQDLALNEQPEASAAVHTWTKDTGASTAVISGAPANPSNDTSLNVTISGSGVVDYQYKFVSGASACTGGSYNGSWIAVATPITDAIGVDGDYKICVIARDSALNIQDEASATSYSWTKDTVAPTATIGGGPTNPSSDASLNVAVSGTDVVDYQYKLVSQASSCSSGGYNGSWIPIATTITDAIGPDGDYKLCVIGRDVALNAQTEASATSYNWTKDNVAPTATLSGTPVDPSYDTNLNVTVAGADVVDYQYKLVSQATACTGGGYNGSWVAVATPLTDFIGSDGDYKLCVIGRDAVLNVQLESNATVYNWTKFTPPPPKPKSLKATADSDSQITLNWASGGGTTAGYRIAYQLGATAPANCASGTQIGEGSISGTSHVISGLTLLTEYSFRVCAINNKISPDVSGGVTQRATTLDMIGSFDFLAAENGALASDVVGTFFDRTVFLTVPNGTNLSALVPDITHFGDSVSPQSNVAADFSAGPIVYTVTKGVDQYDFTVWIYSNSDSFSDGAGDSYDGWTEYNYVNGIYPLYREVNGRLEKIQDNGFVEGAHMIVPDNSFHRDKLAVSIAFPSAFDDLGEVELRFFYQDASNYYYAGISSSGVIGLFKVVGGTKTTLVANITIVNAYGTAMGEHGTYTVTVIPDGTITAYGNGVELISYQDTLSFTDGNIGLYSNNRRPIWDDFKMTNY